MKKILLQLGVLLLLAIQARAQLTADAGLSQTICHGNSVTLGGNPTAQGGTGPYTYTWAPPAGLSDASVSNPVATPSNTTAYNLTVTDNVGASTTASVIINFHTPTAFTQFYSSDTVLCAVPGVINFGAAMNAQAPPYAYSWDFGDGSTSAVENPTHAYAAAGLFNVTLGVTDSNHCVVNNSLVISASQMVVTAIPTNVTCFGANNGSVQAMATGGAGNYTYFWSNGAIGQFMNNLPAGVYSVTTTDSHGCSASASVVVTQSSPIAANVVVVNESTPGACDGSVIAAVTGGSPPYTYLWSNNSTVPNQPNLCQGAYTVTVVDGNGCSATAWNVVASSCITNTLVVSITSQDLSCTHPQDTMVLHVTGGTPPYSCFWSTGAATQSQVADQGGVYIGWVTDSLGCQRSVVDTLLNTGLVVTLLSDTPVNCNGVQNGFIKVHATGAVPPYTYLWSNGGTADSLTNIGAGLYTLTVHDAASCSAVFSYTLPQNNTNWGYYVYVNTTNANCSNNGSATAIVYGGTSPYTYLWNHNNDTSQTISGLAPGNYNLTVTGGDGCTRTGQTTIYTSCFNIITGYVYNDVNGNCIKDTGEAYYPGSLNIVATGTGGTYYGYLNNGMYIINVGATGVYTVNISTSYWNSSCTTINNCGPQTVAFGALGDSAVANFGVATSSAYNLALHPGWTTANPGFQKTYWVLYQQLSTPLYVGPAVITFTYDSILQYQNSTNGGIQNSLNHTITWNLASVPQQWVDWNNRPIANFLVPANLPFGYQLRSEFLITPIVSDCDTTDNHIIYHELVTGSHDPNEKEVSPARDLNPEDTALIYTIRFQNTGNDTTWFITVKDTLSPYLEPASVVNLASSHAYTSFNVSENGILTWFFNPIYLVDSNTNADASKGFVMFKVKKKAGLPFNTQIKNRASIYFDYNEGVLTNTVSNTLTDPNNIFNVTNDASIQVSAAPNPFTQATQITVEGVTGAFSFNLYDISGKLLRNLNAISDPRFQLDREGMSAGVYFYSITTTSKQRTFGRLVVE